MKVIVVGIEKAGGAADDLRLHISPQLASSIWSRTEAGSVGTYVWFLRHFYIREEEGVLRPPVADFLQCAFFQDDVGAAIKALRLVREPNPSCNAYVGAPRG